MATYKLIQDIEAEDKILGPLTLRQFIFALVASFFFYLSFIVVAKGAPFMLALFLPPALFCGFFAFPFGRDQPTEVWFLAKLRFWFLPRQRIWNQSGVKELVTITVPKKVERVLTNGLTQTEVKSRLQALANTIDSRGWASKNISFQQPTIIVGDSQRLIDLNNIPQDVPADDVPVANDMMDAINNPIAQQFDTMINQSAEARHQKLVEEINRVPVAAPAAPAINRTQPTQSSSWFVGSGAGTTPQAPQARPIAPSVPAAYMANEEALSQQLRQHATSQHIAYGHLRTVQPLGSQPVAPPTPVMPPQVSASAPALISSNPTILALANNNDLNVETIARQAHRAEDNIDHSQDEIVITLH